MPTAKQIAANRRNAEKSTGAGTEEGKAKTRLGPLKHGLTAETIVLPFESKDDYRELQQSVLDDLRPKGLTQQILLDRFVQRHWISQRIARTERAWLQALYPARLTEGTKAAKNPTKDSPSAYSKLPATPTTSSTKTSSATAPQSSRTSDVPSNAITYS